MLTTRPLTRCLKRQCLTPRASCNQISTTSTPPPPAPSIARLTNRSLTALHGQDAPHFLQGLITNNVRVGETEGFYAAFLNAQGRVLNDVFIYPAAHLPAVPQPHPAYLIESDASSTPHLLTHLRRHKLRAKLTISPLDPAEWSIYHAWTPISTSASPAQPPPITTSCADPRAPGMGHRIIAFRSAGPAVQETAPLEAYTIHRLLHGVAEGQTEILPGVALPHESNLDLMSGVDFRKGCYLGQELTIRTHHTGVVRKRILPVRLYPAASPPPESLEYDSAATICAPSGANISRVAGAGAGSGRRVASAGKFLGAVGDVGLALCRLESMVGGEAGEFELEGGAVRVKAFVPGWHRDRGAVSGSVGGGGEG